MAVQYSVYIHPSPVYGIHIHDDLKQIADIIFIHDISLMKWKPCQCIIDVLPVTPLSQKSCDLHMCVYNKTNYDRVFSMSRCVGCGYH